MGGMEKEKYRKHIDKEQKRESGTKWEPNLNYFISMEQNYNDSSWPWLLNSESYKKVTFYNNVIFFLKMSIMRFEQTDILVIIHWSYIISELLVSWTVIWTNNSVQFMK